LKLKFVVLIIVRSQINWLNKTSKSNQDNRSKTFSFAF